VAISAACKEPLTRQRAPRPVFGEPAGQMSWISVVTHVLKAWPESRARMVISHRGINEVDTSTYGLREILPNING
jgi:hypothetical protein